MRRTDRPTNATLIASTLQPTGAGHNNNTNAIVYGTVAMAEPLQEFTQLI